jgi:hypothetical protein
MLHFYSSVENNCNDLAGTNPTIAIYNIYGVVKIYNTLSRLERFENKKKCSTLKKT